MAGEYLILALAVSLLFYRSIRILPVLAAGYPLYLRHRREEYRRRREERMREEFLDGMSFLLTSLQAGYAMENAFSQALTELRKIYDEDAYIIVEFQYTASQIRMNVPVEELLLSLAARSHVEDIRNFADVFVTARRTGGDLIAIIRNTISGMRQKEETRREIDTVLAGKKMEQKIMSCIPLAILAYVSVTSPDALNGMYQTAIGRIVMTGCLIVYAAAYFLGRKIMDIRV